MLQLNPDAKPAKVTTCNAEVLVATIQTGIVYKLQNNEGSEIKHNQTYCELVIQQVPWKYTKIPDPKVPKFHDFIQTILSKHVMRDLSVLSGVLIRLGVFI